MDASVESLIFYMLGREKPLDDEFDVEELAQQVVAGGDVHQVATDAARAADSPRMTAENRKLWAKQRGVKGLLADVDMDEATAYGHFHRGVVAQTAFELEPDILEMVDEILEDGPDEDDDDDENGDDDDATPLPS